MSKPELKVSCGVTNNRLQVSYKITNNGILLSEEDQERILDMVFQLKADNSDLKELLTMYVAFGEAMAKDCTVQNAYPDGMGIELNETRMREWARQLGIESQRV